jgi:NAD(P)-dependent dehydrogenase (short-subunit alcohol dehydrogenase family)
VLGNILLRERDNTIFVSSHFSREEDWEYVIAKTVERFGRLDGLLNNAGILIRNGIFETSLEEFEKIQSINTNGTFLGMKQAAGLMKKSGSGSIINISSIWGLVGSPTSIAYGARYLLSDESCFVTGTELVIDGGYTAQ